MSVAWQLLSYAQVFLAFTDNAYCQSVRKEFTLLLNLLMLSLLIGCKPFAVVKTTEDNTLFDRLIAQAPQQKVPYPFAALLSYLSRYGKPVGAFIPLGRSLQRHAASFTDPRRIVGFAALDSLFTSPTPPTSTMSIAEFDLNGRLFLGYVENKAQIEVMSLLPGRDAFDFQTVEHYGTPKMRVQLHTSDTCRSCHQHGGPIFTPFPWEETNFVQPIEELLKRHYPQGNIDSIPISIRPERTEAPHAVPRTAPVSMVEKFDNLVADAASILSDNAIWRACPDATCRAQVLKKTFAAIDLALPPPAGVKTPAVAPPPAFIADRFIVSGTDFNILRGLLTDSERRAVLHGYTLSPAAQRIVAKIMQQNSPKPEAELLPHSEIIGFFVESVRLLDGKELPQAFAPLNAAELDTVYAEVEKILTHVHRQDLHLQSELDPQEKREAFVSTDTLKTIVGRRTDALFQQQLLLPANKSLQLESDKLENITLSFLNHDFSDQAHMVLSLEAMLFAEPLGKNVEAECHAKQCTFKNISLNGTVFFEGGFAQKVAHVQEFSFVAGKQKSNRPPVSRLTVSMDNKIYRYELLCYKTKLSIKIRADTSDKGYLCNVYDPWKLDAAIDRLSKSNDSPLHAAVLNHVAVIKALLAELGYDLKTHAGKIDWRKTRRVTTNYAPNSQLHPDVRKILAKYSSGTSLLRRCGGCHDSEVTPAPFLIANDITQLCSNLAVSRDIIIEHLDKNNGIGNMPPDHTSQSENFNDRERQKLLSALQADKPAFCP